jgi:hypothetical protein
MAVNVTIDAGSRADAEVIADALPAIAEAVSRRGYGVVRLRVEHERAALDLYDTLAACVERHNIGWARIRFGEQERMFRSRSQRA